MATERSIVGHVTSDHGHTDDAAVARRDAVEALGPDPAPAGPGRGLPRDLHVEDRLPRARDRREQVHGPCREVGHDVGDVTADVRLDGGTVHDRQAVVHDEVPVIEADEREPERRDAHHRVEHRCCVLRRRQLAQ
jgi:hypothetical protein